jgi:hypothetical protein
MSNFEYYNAIYKDKLIGKYRINLNYNTLLELAQQVNELILEQNAAEFISQKKIDFMFDLLNIVTKTKYRYCVNRNVYSAVNAKDYNIKAFKLNIYTEKNCDKYLYVDSFASIKLCHVFYPDNKQPEFYWQGDYIEGIGRNDVSQYLIGNDV